MIKKIIVSFYVLFLLLININVASADALKDIQIGNKLQIEVNSGNLTAAERLLKDLSDPSLKKIYTSNVIAKYYEKNNLKLGCCLN